MKYYILLLMVTAIVSAQVQFDLRRKYPSPDHNERRWIRRQEQPSPVNVRHDSVLGVYFITIKIGTPGTTLDLQLRSDQSYSWFPSSNSTWCIEDPLRTCAEHGSFNQNYSSTFAITPETFNKSYTNPNGTKVTIADGYFFNDTLEIGDLTVTDLTMGIAYVFSSFNSGILGLGYGGEESELLPQDNLAVQLVAKGLIPTAAYSLWFNDEDAASGLLLLGAIDKTKYDGDLIIIDSFNSSAFGSTIYLSSVEATSPSGTDSLQTEDSQFPLGFIVGVATTRVPPPLAQHIWAVAGATYSDQLLSPLIPCRLRDSAGAYTFKFGGAEGPSIRVSLKHLIWPSDRSDQYYRESDFTPDSNETMCVFTLWGSSSPSDWFIGENVLQAAYFAVDLYNQEIAMAQARYNVDDTDVVTFVAHGAGVPSATYAASQPTDKPTSIATTTSFPPFTPSASYAAAAGFATLTDTAAAPTQTGESASALSVGAKAGVGVGVPLGVALVAALGFIFWRRRRGQPPPYTPEPPPVSPMSHAGTGYYHPEVSELAPKTTAETPTAKTAAAAEMPGSDVSPSINYGSPSELSPSTSPQPNSTHFNISSSASAHELDASANYGLRRST